MTAPQLRGHWHARNRKRSRRLLIGRKGSGRISIPRGFELPEVRCTRSHHRRTCGTPGATVIDVGASRTDASLVSDVDFDSVVERWAKRSPRSRARMPDDQGDAVDEGSRRSGGRRG